MPKDETLHVVAATAVRAVETVDDGDAMAIRMTTAGSDELCVLLPTGAMGEMLFLRAEALGGGPGLSRIDRPFGTPLNEDDGPDAERALRTT